MKLIHVQMVVNAQTWKMDMYADVKLDLLGQSVKQVYIDLLSPVCYY